jgi:hypothetical protein
MASQIIIYSLAIGLGIWSAVRLNIVGFAVVSALLAGGLIAVSALDLSLVPIGLVHGIVAWLMLNVSFVVFGIFYQPPLRHEPTKFNFRSIFRLF